MADGAKFHLPFPREPLSCGASVAREAWGDYNDHMNVGYYGVAFDTALEVWYEDWVNLGASYTKREGMGPFALQSNLHFLRELRLGERFEVFVQLLDCDAKRWHLFLTMRKEDGALAATLEQLSMNVDLSARRSAPIAEPQRRRLEEMLAAHKDLARPEQVGAPIGIRRKPPEA